MERFLFEYGRWEAAYNCSSIDLRVHPVEERRHRWAGLILILLACIFELLYIPCMVVLSKHTHLPCYSIMRFIGVIDMLNILFTGVYTGIGLTAGWVFCSHPTLIYLAGVCGTSLWAVVSLSSLILALNRCVEIVSSHWGAKLFGGKRVYVWQTLASLYGLFVFWFANPGLLNSVYGAWMFHPYVGFSKEVTILDNAYVQPVHYLNNAFVTLCLPLLYLFFAVALSIQRSFLRRLYPADQRANASNQYGTFVQVLIISLVNIVVSVVYIVIQYANSPVLFIVASFSWLFTHGCPPIIYLVLNRMLRSEALDLMETAKSFITNTQNTPVSLNINTTSTSVVPPLPAAHPTYIVITPHGSTIHPLPPNRLPALQR